jgi:class 3 adenylate cyclase/tetratricopeptide (TPR) repeat protein
MSDAPRPSIATILFTDLVGSTELMGRVGDERAQGLFAAHHQLLADAVSAHGGSELQWLGDGLMVAFASTADAVRCAIAMQQAAARGTGAAERLAIRVGLNAGEILRQETGTGSGYFGTPVVTARRLCDRAGAGQILCTSIVSGLLAGRAAFRFRDLGPSELKGLADSVSVCQVVYDADLGTALPVQTPFVGREGELARLAQRLDAARAGRGGLAMVVGEPGIGKTRTLEELAARARRQEAVVVWGRCFEGESAAPFAPFAEAFADHARQSPPEVLEKVLGRYAPALSLMVPALRARIPTLSEPAALEPNEERQRLFDAVTQVLLAMSERAPVLLVLDDLHWADAGTIAMLRHVARFAARGRLLLVGAYRDGELDRRHPLAEALAGLKRETEYERVALKGLAEAEVGRLLETVAAQEVPEALVHAIHAETEGNPFFVREVLLHLVEEGKLYRAEDRWRSDYSIDAMGIPEGVRQVIGRRLSRLSDEANRLLSAASGFQGAFRFEVAAGAARLEEEAALDALDEALEAQLVRPTGEAEVYDFAHALIRHALYAELSPSRQVRLHRRIAEGLERIWGERAPDHAGEIARQWHRSAALPGAERGAGYCLLAAERAERSAAHQEAATLLRMALELLPEADARRPRALARLGLALAWSLELEEAARVAGEAGERIAASEGSDAAADYLADATRTLWSAGQSPLAWPLAQQGLRHAGERRDRTWALLTCLDLLRRHAEDPEGVGFPLRSPDTDAILPLLVEVAESYFDIVTEEVATTYLGTSARTRAAVLTRASSPLQVGFLAGEYRRSLELFQREAEVRLEHGALVGAALALGIGARLHLALGDLASADAWYGRALGLAERAGNPPYLALQMLGHPSERAWIVGSLESVAAFAEPLRPIADNPSIENRWVAAPVWAFASYAMTGLGDREGALAYLERTRRAIERGEAWTPNYTFMLFWASYAGWELSLRDDWPPLLERNLREKTLAGDCRYASTDARLALAWLCALQGRHDEATGWFAQARTVLDEQGARPLRAITDFEEARMYARRAAPGDRERVLPLLDAAVRHFEAIGMPGWIRRAEALRHELGG